MRTMVQQLKTMNLIKGSHFLMLLPDDLIIRNNCSKKMISIHKKYNSAVMASLKVNNFGNKKYFEKYLY